MKNLLFAFLTVLVIAACGDSPTSPEPEFEPYQIETWLITSPTSAEWVGETSNQTKIKTMQSDTIEIKQPGDRSLEIWRENAMPDYAFKMQFTDSSITVEDNRQHNVKLPTIENPKGGEDYPLRAGGNDLLFTENFMQSTFDMQYDCGANFDKKAPMIQLTYKKEDDTIFRVYNIHVNGILDAVRDIMPC